MFQMMVSHCGKTTKVQVIILPSSIKYKWEHLWVYRVWLPILIATKENLRFKRFVINQANLHLSETLHLILHIFLMFYLEAGPFLVQSSQTVCRRSWRDGKHVSVEPRGSLLCGGGVYSNHWYLCSVGGQVVAGSSALTDPCPHVLYSYVLLS